MFRLHTRLLCFLANMGLLHVQRAGASRGTCSRSANSLLLVQLRTAQRKWLLAVWGRYFVSALCKILCEAETVHVQRHTYNYPSLICFAVDGMCSVPSSTPAGGQLLTVCLWSCEHIFSVQEVNRIEVPHKKTGGLLNQSRVAFILKAHS